MKEEVVEHEHPLHLLDLQPNFPHYEDEDEDDDEDKEEGYVKAITQQDFQCRRCDRCKQEITWFHRHYYECSLSSCHGYSLHKLCGELPIKLTHTSHAHRLTLVYYEKIKWYCVLCGTNKVSGLFYKCVSCAFAIHANCAMASVEDRIIYHPGHQHRLTAILHNPILFKCHACGKEHKGLFYVCTIHCGFFIHSDCLFLPHKLMIQESTNHTFSHPHPLILSYSFPLEEQVAKFIPKCRVCNGYFFDESMWIYKCEKCLYYTHLDCPISRQEPFMSIISSYGNRLKKLFKDSDYPNLIHLPFRNESDSVLKHLFSKHSFRLEDEVQGAYHQHPLLLVRKEWNDVEMPSSSRRYQVVSCHNPMKKIQLLCNGCMRPITSVPFYKCENEQDDVCNFVLHEWCTRLPHQLTNYPLHPQHTLTLQPNVSHKFFSVFTCSICKYPCNGFAYSCPQYDCDYHIDVKCGFIPKKITHDAHPGHLLSRVQDKWHRNYCRLCIARSEDTFTFLCDTCEVWVHMECALLLPDEIRHSYDEHPMSLTYFPVEDHKSEYFCEICETEFDPERCFYHCRKCDYSIHPACAPLILQSEAALAPSPRDYYNYLRIYKYLNIKFGGLLNAKCHPHPVSFVQGIERDGNCSECDDPLHYKMIFKCLPCKFAIHLECMRKSQEEIE